MLEAVKRKIANGYYQYGLFCASHPVWWILFAASVVFIFCSPLTHLSLPQYPPELYVTKLHAMQESNGTNQPTWYKGPPAAYIQQILVRSAVTPWQNELIPMDAYRAPIATSFQLVEQVVNFQVNSSSSSFSSADASSSISLSDLCYRVEESVYPHLRKVLPAFNCLVLSPHNLWSGLTDFQDDENLIVTTYARFAHLEIAPSLREILFGLSWKETGMRRYFFNKQQIVTYSLTLVFNKFDSTFHRELSKFLLDKYHDSAANNNSYSDGEVRNIFFREQKGIEYYLPLVVVYSLLFLYIYSCVRKFEMVKSQWGLAIASLASMLASLAMSLGICAYFGVVPTLEGSEVLPYMVVIVGFENIVVLTRALVLTPTDRDVKERVALALSQESWSITKTKIQELVFLGGGLLTMVPVLQQFFAFSIIVVVTDFFLQMTFFVPVLAIDTRRMELSDLRHAVPAERYSTPYSSLSGVRTSNQPVPFEQHSAVFRLPRRLRFLYFVARYRLGHRILFALFLIWTALILYKSVIVLHLIRGGHNVSQGVKETYLSPKTIQTLEEKNHDSEPLQTGASSRPEIGKLLFHDRQVHKSQHILHWPTLFGFYNVTLARRFLSILPPIYLTIPLSPDTALRSRHVKDNENHKLDPIKMVTSYPFDDDSDGEKTVFGFLGSYDNLDFSLIGMIAIPVTVLSVYMLSACYQCMCSRDYGQQPRRKPSNGSTRPRLDEACPLPVVVDDFQNDLECFAASEQFLVTADLRGELGLWDMLSGDKILAFSRRQYGLPPRLNAESPSVSVAAGPDLTPLIDTDFGKMRDKPARGATRRNGGFDFGAHYKDIYDDHRALREHAAAAVAAAKKPESHCAAVWSVDVRGSWVIAGCADGAIELWYTQNGTLLLREHTSSLGVTDVRITPSNHVVAARVNGLLDIYSLRSENGCGMVRLNQIASNRAHQRPISCLAITAGRVVTGSEDRQIRVFRLEDGIATHTFYWHGAAVTALAADKGPPHGAVSGDSEGTLCLFDPETGCCIHQKRLHEPHSIVNIECTPSYTVSLDNHGVLKITERSTGVELHSVGGDMVAIGRLNADYMVVVCDSELCVLDLESAIFASLLADRRWNDLRSIRVVDSRTVVLATDRLVYVVTLPALPALHRRDD